MERTYGDHMGIQGDPTGDPMGISWAYNGCPLWDYHGEPIEDQWGPIREWHGDPMGIAMDPNWKSRVPNV